MVATVTLHDAGIILVGVLLFCSAAIWLAELCEWWDRRQAERAASERFARGLLARGLRALERACAKRGEAA